MIRPAGVSRLQSLQKKPLRETFCSEQREKAREMQYMEAIKK